MMSTEVTGDNSIRQRTNVQETSDTTKEEIDKETEEMIKPETETWKKNLLPRRVELTLQQLIGYGLLFFFTVTYLEQIYLGFPGWAEKNAVMPNYTFTKWFNQNVYLIVALLIGYLIFSINGNRYLPLGLGILLYGTFNNIQDIAYSAIMMKYYPGVITGLVWWPIACIAYKRVREVKRNDKLLLWQILFFTFLYTLVPFVVFFFQDTQPESIYRWGTIFSKQQETVPTIPVGTPTIRP